MSESSVVPPLTNEGGPPIKVVGRAEQESFIATLTLAFAVDPMVRWVWPDPQQYLEAFPGYAMGSGGEGFDRESGFYVDGFLGAALWMPPGIPPDEEALVNLLQNTVPEERQGDLYAVLEQMGEYHPEEPHWYLPLIGVDPTQQGKGLGSALMKHALECCDRDHSPAYLENSNPRNTPLYERHGFEVLGTIQVASSPPMIPMFRKAR